MPGANGRRRSPRRAVAGRSRREFSVVIERDEEGWYVASVPELPGCHTQARSLDRLMLRVREAIVVCLDAAGEAGTSQFIGVQRVAV